MRSCENAIGVMTKLQTSLVTEETWVDGATEKISVLPTATSALELDVSHSLHITITHTHFSVEYQFLIHTSTKTFTTKSLSLYPFLSF